MPRGNNKDEVRELFRKQILFFKNDLETLSGNKITEEKLREKIILHKNIKSIVRKISELRKQEIPPLSGSDFLTIARACRTIPA